MGKFGNAWSLDKLPPAMRAEAEQLLGVQTPASTAKKSSSTDARAKRRLAEKFEEAWNAMNGPAYATEMSVHPERKFRYDYCWPDIKVALELQGGIYMAAKGHVGPSQFKTDCDKLNLSNVLGVTVFKFATGQVTPDNLVMLRDFLLARRKALNPTSELLCTTQTPSPSPSNPPSDTAVEPPAAGSQGSTDPTC